MKARGALVVAIVAFGCRSRRTIEAPIVASARVSSATESAPSTSSAPTSPPVARRISGAWGVAYVPASLPKHAPVIAYFHGMWATPEDSCSSFERGVEGVGVLMCPRGNGAAAAGGAWVGALPEKRASFDRAMDAVRAIVPDLDDGGVLLGFSSGARFALDLALAEPGKWGGLVLMSMDLAIAPAALKKAGIRRVLFASADDDLTAAALRASTMRCNLAKLDARYVSFGKVGHHFAIDMEAKMADAIAWVTAE